MDFKVPSLTLTWTHLDEGVTFSFMRPDGSEVQQLPFLDLDHLKDGKAFATGDQRLFFLGGLFEGNPRGYTISICPVYLCQCHGF